MATQNQREREPSFNGFVRRRRRVVDDAGATTARDDRGNALGPPTRPVLLLCVVGRVGFVVVATCRMFGTCNG